MKTNTTTLDLDAISDELSLAWSNELSKNGVGEKSKKLREKLSSFNKANFPVIIERISGTDFFTGKSYNYGQINFWKPGVGWADTTIFHNVDPKTRNYVSNELGETINIRFCRGGGSANLNFDYTNENVGIIKDALIKAGYKVEIKGCN